jgi:uncharacterized protein YdeI (YjbR/CyaY-like superfamily)
MDPIFFTSPAEWRAWLHDNHAAAKEVYVGYYKVGTKKPTISWQESIDEALKYGWIDAVRKRIDDDSYMIRFTPRKPNSVWSAANIKRVAELTELGLMQPAGMAIYEARKEDKSVTYAYEQAQAPTLEPDAEAQLRANDAAWAFWQAQAPSYQKGAAWWVVSAKKDETRRSRLATLIDDCANGRLIAQYRYGKNKATST